MLLRDLVNPHGVTIIKVMEKKMLRYFNNWVHFDEMREWIGDIGELEGQKRRE